MYYLLSFCILLGLLIGYGIRWWLESKYGYGGAILVQKQEGKLVYTLEVFDDPEQLQYKRQILFRVDSSELSPNRN